MSRQFELDFKKGKWVFVFDPRIWKGRDKGINKHCWVEARIVRGPYSRPGGVGGVSWIDNNLYDVEIGYDKYISRGHFVTAIKPFEKKNGMDCA